MLIDWFTVLAQAVNFLILVWLMKRYLYQPILSALEAREKRIAAELADADAKKAAAEAAGVEFKRKNDEFDRQRAALLNKATDDAATERNRLYETARTDADSFRDKLQNNLSGEYRALHAEVARMTRDEVFAISRKTLTDLATTGLEERLADVFTRRLREMDERAKQTFGESLNDPSFPALVRSAFDLPAAQRTAIQQALNETFSAEIQLRFETAPELISGIELSTNGQKLAWSIADYLGSLEKGVDELLKEQDKAKTKAQAAKPSDLTLQIGKRAYELYEEQGHHDGRAAQDWEKAEGEIRKKIVDSTLAKTRHEYKLEAREKPEPAVKPESKAEPDAVAKPGPVTAAKVEPEPAIKAEPKSEGKAKPVPDVEAENKTGSESLAKADTVSAAKVEPEPAIKSEPKSESKAKPVPDVGSETVTKAAPVSAARAEPEPEESKPETSSG